MGISIIIISVHGVDQVHTASKITQTHPQPKPNVLQWNKSFHSYRSASYLSTFHTDFHEHLLLFHSTLSWFKRDQRFHSHHHHTQIASIRTTLTYKETELWKRTQSLFLYISTLRLGTKWSYGHVIQDLGSTDNLVAEWSQSYHYYNNNVSIQCWSDIFDDRNWDHCSDDDKEQWTEASCMSQREAG